MQQNTITLDLNEQQSLKVVCEKSLERYGNLEDVRLFKDLPTFATELPPRLREFMNEFKYNPNSKGYCVISGLPLDELSLGPTPSHWQLPTNHDTCRETLMAMCLTSSVLGDAFGWLTQQDGNLIHDVMPIKKHAEEQLGTGSNQELSWHTEDAFHELRGDYLMLLCLRNPDSIPTTLSRPDFSKLSEQNKQILFEKHFVIRPDNSHKRAFESEDRTNERVNGSLGTVDIAYEEMHERDSAPAKVAVLFGPKSTPYLRIDPYYMEEPETEKARKALNALCELVENSLVDVSLKGGDCIVIDNFMAVHGRRAFAARHDGTDRWLKRINIVRDIRRYHKVLDSPTARVIY